MSVSVDSNTAALVPQGKHVGQRAILIQRPATIIGARHRSHVHLLSKSVSKAHAVIIKTDHGYYVRDLASRTGTFVNGRPVRESDLAEGDLLKIGNFVFKFQDTEPAGARTRGIAAEPAQFEIAGAPAPVAIPDRAMLIGRRAECDVSLLEQSVSTAHALLFDLDGRWFLRDLSSRTGTFVNGNKIHQEEVHFGDQFLIGDTTLKLATATSAAVVPNQSDVDELEDLIGTAPLLGQDEDEALDDELSKADRAAASAKTLINPVISSRSRDNAPIPLDFDDDLKADRPSVTPDEAFETTKATGPAIGSGVPAPMGVIQAERRSPEPVNELPSDAIDLDQEIDLSTDPDVSGPADTAAIKLAPDETQQKPAISPRVVDSDSGDTMSEGQRLLVDAEQRRSLPSSATSANLQGASEEAVASANIESHELDELNLDDLGPIDTTEPPAAEEVELQPRSGWRFRDANAAAKIETPAVSNASADIKPQLLSDPEEDQTDTSAVEFVAAVPSDALNLPTDDSIDASSGTGPIELLGTTESPSDEADVAEPAQPADSDGPVASEEPIELAEPITLQAETDAPKPDAELSAMDFSDLELEAPPAGPSDETLTPSHEPAESQSVSEVDLDLTPVTELPTASDPNEVITQLISPDAFAGLPPVESPRPKRRRATTGKQPTVEKVVERPTKSERPAIPEKPQKVEKPAEPAKPSKPVIATPAPTPKPVKTPRKKVSRKPPQVVADSVVPVAMDRPDAITSIAPVVSTVLQSEPFEVDQTVSNRATNQNTTDDNRSEVLDITEPTPESAFGLEGIADLAPLAEESTASDPLTDTSFGRQLNDFSADAAEPIVDDVSPREPDAEPVAYVSETSGPIDLPEESATSITQDEPAAAPAEPERPRNAFEQIAASLAAAPMEDDEASPSVTVVPELDLSELEEVPSSKPTSEVDGDGWPMPDESDMLLPEEDFEDQPSGRDQASFIGGLPLPLSQQTTVVKVDRDAGDHSAYETPSSELINELSVEATERRADADELGRLSELELPDLDLSDSIHGEPSTREPMMLDGDAPTVAVSQANVGARPARTSDVEPTATPVAAPVPTPAASVPVAELESSASAPANKLPPRPKQMGRRVGPTPFAKTPFDVLPDDAPTSTTEGSSVPAFTGPGPATFGRVTTAFDGLAMPPVRETDVFSQMPGHAMGGNGKGTASPSRPEGRTRPVSPNAPAPVASKAAGENSTLGLVPETIEYATPAKAAKPARPATPGFRPPVMPAEGQRTAPKRRRFGLKWLLPIMVLCMIGTAVVIYSAVPVVTQIDAFVDYDKLDKVPPTQRVEIQEKQIRVVDEVRKNAADILRNKNNNITPGFLANTREGAIDFKKDTNVFFPEPGGRLVIRRQSQDPTKDADRLEALLKAIEVANGPLKDAAGSSKRAADVAREELSRHDKLIRNKEADLASANRIGENRPTGEQLGALENHGKRLEASHTTASVKVLNLKAEIERLRAATSNEDATRTAAQLADKQRELVVAQAAADETYKAFTANTTERLRLEAEQNRASKVTDEKMAIQRDLDALRADRKSKADAVDAADATAARAVTVVPFTSRIVNIRADSPTDPRMLYVTISSIIIWILFIGLVALQRRATRSSEPMVLESTDEAEPISDELAAAEPEVIQEDEQRQPAVPV